jgi:hypothetical protein
VRLTSAAPVGFFTAPVEVIVQTLPASVPEYVAVPPWSVIVVCGSSEPVAGLTAFESTESACATPASARSYAFDVAFEWFALRAFALEK